MFTGGDGPDGVEGFYMIYASFNILGNRFIRVVRVRGRNGSQDEQKTGQFQAAVCYFSHQPLSKKAWNFPKSGFFFCFLVHDK